MRSATLKSFSQLVISFDVSLCSVDAAHMLSQGFDNQL